MKALLLQCEKSWAAQLLIVCRNFLSFNVLCKAQCAYICIYKHLESSVTCIYTCIFIHYVLCVHAIPTWRSSQQLSLHIHVNVVQINDQYMMFKEIRKLGLADEIITGKEHQGGSKIWSGDETTGCTVVSYVIDVASRSTWFTILALTRHLLAVSKETVLASRAHLRSPCGRRRGNRRRSSETPWWTTGSGQNGDEYTMKKWLAELLMW